MHLQIESFYFPIVPVFEEVIASESVIIQVEENYQKQSFRNRTYIRTSSGVQKLIVPVVHSSNKNIQDIKIDYSQKWQQVHRRSIKTAYGKSAFFEHYFDGIDALISQKHDFLIDLNLACMSKCLSYLKLPQKIFLSNSVTIDPSKHINDRTRSYTNDNHVPRVVVEDKNNQYFQVFGNDFVKNLSIVDLLFNEGTNAVNYLLHNKNK